MNYMIAILPKMAGFLLLVLIGFTASRIGVIKKEAMPSISGFLLKIVLPALTISLIRENQTTFYTMARYGRMVIAQILMYFIMAAGGILGSRICHLSGTTSNVHRGCSVGGNYGFLVIPLIMTLFGDQGGNVYIPICSVIDTTLVWTLGFTLFTNGVGQKENPWKKIIMNPIFISIILGLCLTSFHIPVPDMIMNTIDSVGNTCYSWGLIYLGCSLGFMKLTNIFKYRSILVLVFTKLLVIPLIVYFISHHFLTNVESMILMLISAAPSMTTSSMIAEQYHLDEEYASTAVVTTTLFCMLIIPLLFGLISL